MDLTVFKEKNDRKNGIGSDIFEYHNLTDFEKILFLEHNVNDLISLLKKKDSYIKQLQGKLENIKNERDPELHIARLKRENTRTQETIRKLKALNLEQLNK